MTTRLPSLSSVMNFLVHWPLDEREESYTHFKEEVIKGRERNPSERIVCQKRNRDQYPFIYRIFVTRVTLVHLCLCIHFCESTLDDLVQLDLTNIFTKDIHSPQRERERKAKSLWIRLFTFFSCFSLHLKDKRSWEPSLGLLISWRSPTPKDTMKDREARSRRLKMSFFKGGWLLVLHPVFISFVENHPVFLSFVENYLVFISFVKNHLINSFFCRESSSLSFFL